jgi:hypothetical protein
MRILFSSLLFQLLFLFPLHLNAQSPDRLEHQAIKLLLDNFKLNEPNNNFGAIIYSCFQNNDALIWFKYKHDDEFIEINYLIFSQRRMVSSIKNNYAMGLLAFLGKIIHEKKLDDSLEVNQIQITMPLGLRKKPLLDLIYSKKRINKTKDGMIQIATKECPPYFWGFECAVGESSEYDSNYIFNPLGQIILEIVEPIVSNVLLHNKILQNTKELNPDRGLK